MYILLSYVYLGMLMSRVGNSLESDSRQYLFWPQGPKEALMRIYGMGLEFIRRHLHL